MLTNENKKAIKVAVPVSTYELFKAIMRVMRIKQSSLLRNIIACAIKDYKTDKDYDFSKITPEMRGAKSEDKLQTSISIEQYAELLIMVEELSMENVSQLLRRIVSIITLDYFMETNGLPVIRMPEVEK